MKNKLILTIIILSALAGVFFFSRFLLPSERGGREGFNNNSAQAAAPRTGLTLDLNFGNNNGSAAAPTVFDSSGFGNHATSTAGATSPTCNNKFCSFDGSANLMTVINSGFFSHLDTGETIVIKFSPDFSITDGLSHTFFAKTAFTGQNLLYKSAANTISFVSGASTVGYVDGSVYGNLWKVGQPNVLIMTETTSANSTYFNGVNTYNGSAPTTAFSTENVTIGNAGVYAGYFKGKIYYMKTYGRVLTAAEVATLSSDRKSFGQAPNRTASSTVGQLVGWWTMDANDISGTNYYDRSGFNNTATSTASPTIKAGKINQAVNLNGTTQYLSSAIHPNASRGTVSLWEKANLSGALNNMFFSWRTAGATNLLEAWTDTTGNVNFRYGSGTLTVACSFCFNWDTTTWHHFVFTWDSSAGRTIYRDGVSIATAAGTWTPQDFSGANLNISGLAAYFIPGSIDDVRVYNYAFSAQEVANLYNSAAKKYTAAPSRLGLVGWWKMDANDISGTTYYDASYTGNNATSTGSPTIAAGKIDQAVSLNGSSQYLLVSNPGFNTYFKKTTGSASFWVKANSFSAPQTLFAAMTDNTTDDELRFDYRPDNIKEIQIVLTNDGGVQLNARTPANTITDTNWHLVTLTSDASTLKVYVDGINQTLTIASGSNTGQWFSSPADANLLVFGVLKRAAPIQYFNGSIDDARVYNRALSADEVANLYQAGKINYVR